MDKPPIIVCPYDAELLVIGGMKVQNGLTTFAENCI
jgi:predicted glycosyl hydrolase (DUF1957 family)